MKRFLPLLIVSFLFITSCAQGWNIVFPDSSSELSKKLSNQFENLYKIVVFDGIKHDNYYLYDSVQEEIKEYLESRLK